MLMFCLHSGGASGWEELRKYGVWGRGRMVKKEGMEERG